MANVKEWEESQVRTYTNWINYNLGDEKQIQDITQDISESDYLITLLEKLSGKQAYPHKNAIAKTRIVKLDNIGKAVNFMREEKINTSVSAENIVDGDKKYILGMIWTMILKYKINANRSSDDSKQEEPSVENNALLEWVNSLNNIKVNNFSNDWKDGNALVGLTVAVSFGEIKSEEFDGIEPLQKIVLCQHAALQKLKIPTLMDVRDLICDKPDPKSVMTYISVYKERYDQMLIENEEKIKREQERLEAEHLEKERLERERLEAERIERERIEAERLEQERLERERLEAERLEKERLEAERLEAERLERERLEAERLEQERLERERIEAERLEQERLERERLEAERLEAERLERERLEAERLERERLEAERLEKERLEAERLEAERLERERIEAERLEQERLERERLEAERLEKERIEAEKQKSLQLSSSKTSFFDIKASADAWILQSIQAAYKENPQIKIQWWYPLVETLSADTFRELQDWFKKIDKDKSGTLELSELLKAKWPKDMKMNKETIKRLMLIFDADGSGSIGFFEFIALYNWMKLCDSTFRHFDVDKSDSLDITEVQAALPQLGFRLNKKSCENLIRSNKSLIGKKKLNKIQFIGAVSYLAQCRTIYQMTFNTPGDQLDGAEFDKFVNLVLGLVD